ncbi:MAG: cupin domain-containing protein [bacterium]
MLVKYRYLFLLVALLLLIIVTSEFRPVNSEETARQGRVIQPNEGDSFQLSNGIGTIKVDPNIGAENFAMGTQYIEPGRGIRVHLHEHLEEVLYITSGEGTGIVGEKRAPLVAGTAIYIPKGVWHGIESDGKEMELL